MAGDLWEVAINCHPKTLCDLEGTNNRIANKVGSEGRDRSEWKAAQASSGPANLFETIRRVTQGTFNAGSLMGTILKEDFHFQKLSGIRRAYSRAFSKNVDTIDTILADHALDKLALVRNLLLHKSGQVDDKFLKGASELNWSINAPINREIPLDGEIVNELLKPVFLRAIDLLVAVDEWIKS
jgi:hypothetical protein